jgi:DNA-binding Lrp family transcriptional regulator
MEDSQILELLRKKSPQTTLEIAKAAKMSWHVIQEQLLELQIDGKLDRITVGRQNLWFPKGSKWKGTASTNIILLGVVAIIGIFFVLSSLTPVQNSIISTNISQSNYSSETTTGSEAANVLETLTGQNIGRAELGNLTIVLVNISQGSYEVPELGNESGEIKYYKIYAEIFNSFSRIPGVYTLEDNEVINISLEDNLGNSYKPDTESRTLFDSLDLFGNSMEITPMNIRKGYLIFPEISGVPEKLTIRIKSGAKAEFELG